MCSILADTAENRDYLREKLKDNGIETRPLFYPVHTMPMYSDKFRIHPVSEDISLRGINLPSFPELTEVEVGFISDCIKKYYNSTREVNNG
jgi:perosamine synthetase